MKYTEVDSTIGFWAEPKPRGSIDRRRGCIALILPLLRSSNRGSFCFSRKPIFELYRNNLKNRNFDKETPQNSCPERATIADRQGAREDVNFDGKPTQSKTDSSSCFGITSVYRYLFLLIFVSCFLLCHAQAVVLNLTGHLSDLKIDEAQKQLENSQDADILIYIDSWSGELTPALKLAEQVHALKISNGIKVSVYIENRAIGASAIFPFLADEWNSTASMIWGNVYYGHKIEIPSSEVTKTLQSFISTLNPQADLLYLIAQAIVDPNVQFIYQNGGKLVPVSSPQEPSIFSRTELDELGFDIITMTSEQFHARYRTPSSLVSPSQTSVPQLINRLSHAIHYNKSEVNYVGYISIDQQNPIDETTFLSVNLAIEEFKKKGVIFIILDLNTSGGELFSALRIAEVLQRVDTEDHIPVIAIINDRALSAGAMIAYSCRFIAVTDKSLMGAAERFPIIPMKMIPALRNTFGSLAQFFGRNPLIAEAMVDKELFLVQRNGAIVALTNEQEIQLQGAHPDQVLVIQGKLLTLTGKQLIDLQVADFYLPNVAIPHVTEAEEESGRWSSAQNRLFYLPFFEEIPSAIILSYSSWKISFYSVLCSHFVSILLLMGFIIGIYFALCKLRLTIGAVVAFLCIFFVVLSSSAYGTSDWMKMTLLSAGVMLLLAELLILPNNRFIGILGCLVTMGALTILLLPKWYFVHFAQNYSEWNLTAFHYFSRAQFLLGFQMIALIVIALFSRYLTPRLVKRRERELLKLKEGSVAELPEIPLPRSGAEGVAFTSLKPYGKILVQNHLFNAIAEEGNILKEEKVTVSKVVGGIIFVIRKF